MNTYSMITKLNSKNEHKVPIGMNAKEKNDVPEMKFHGGE